ncbi:hypothetical protein ACOBWA_13545 [Psychrobacter sp. ER1]|uniref:hypothetical protein n=1 Tax=Psychrobacter sp. ER1 TaxID=3406645 RepID=UPI003B437E7C
MDSSPTPRIYLGTGGYSDTDLLGTLYSTGTKKLISYVSTPSNMVQSKSTAPFMRPSGKKPLLGWSIKLMYRLTAS